MEALVKALEPYVRAGTLEVNIITTIPNRYKQFQTTALLQETYHGAHVQRITLPKHQNGFIDQAKAFRHFFFKARIIAKNKHYNLVLATSSRLFTAFLGATIAKQQNCPLFLDIRDIFTETMNDVLSKPFKWCCLPVFNFIERYTIKQALALNLVSQGFAPYYEPKVSLHCQLSYVSNGVDNCFQDIDYTKPAIHPIKKILYAGNMGEGQGLEKIIPALAEATLNRCEFILIGDGGRQQALKNACKHLSNVIILPPIAREELIKQYKDADILFLHLNDYPAFKRVLPSKLFEYAVTGKPILAGIPGYSAKFVNAHINGSWLFPPCDTKNGIQQLQAILNQPIQYFDRKSFCEEFDRQTLMQELANRIVRMIQTQNAL